MVKRKAVFLDRDGTINVEKDHLHRCELWEWIPGAVEAIKALNSGGWLVIVVSNQAGVARGLYSEAAIARLHARVDEQLAAAGARIDRYYFCPHHPEFGERIQCECRKPRPGMLLQGQHDWNIDMRSSFLIGDKLSDMEAACAVGVTPILVATGYGRQERARCGNRYLHFDDLAGAAAYIGSARRSPSLTRMAPHIQ
jgi:D-glycero-D-manno-heptose 1,7-bisphosphate phosphatase